jgi:hypothetical protein
MPLTPSLPTWLAVNNANFTSPTGLTDAYSGQQVAAGGLNLGEYFDMTNGEAANVSYATNGVLYAGRYRMVQVDSGATAANVKTGTIGYLRQGGGGAVRTVVITNAGTGATAGTYSVAATAGTGGGSGAVIQVVVGSGGTITSVSVLNGGSGYNSVPTFSLTATGTTAGAVAGQLDSSPNIVTSFDQVAASPATALAVRPVVFLNSITPGNYGFIQELGTATVLGNATFTSAAAIGALIQPKASGSGTVDVPTSTTAVTSTSIGLAIDLPIVSSLFKIQLGFAASVVQD